MDTILKIEYKGEIRRALLKGSLNFAAISNAVEEVWPGHAADGAGYMDETGDICTLREQSLSDFLATSKQFSDGDSLTRLKLDLCPVPAPQSGYPGCSQSSSARPQPDDLDCEKEVTNTCAADSAMAPAGTFNMFTPPTSPRGVEEQVKTLHFNMGTAADLTDQCNPFSDKFPSSDAVSGVDACIEPGRIKSAPKEPKLDRKAIVKSADLEANGDVGCGLSEDFVADHDVEEKIDIVLAAFDDDGDGHLNFAEMNTLHTAAWGGQISLEVFERMCTDEGEDAKTGLGREALMCVYSRCRTLDGDFEAAREKLRAIEHCSNQESRTASCSASHPLSLVFKNPGLAIPFALDATERLRQGVAASLTRKGSSSESSGAVGGRRT